MSPKEITFLDTTVYKRKRFQESKVLDIKTYTKPSETYQYLDRTSCHPESLGELSYQESAKSSDPDNLQAALSTFNAKLTERGYDVVACDGTSLDSVIGAGGFQKPLQFERKELFEDRPRNKDSSTWA